MNSIFWKKTLSTLFTVAMVMGMIGCEKKKSDNTGVLAAVGLMAMSSNPTGQNPTGSTYSIGGTITGLTAGGLV